MLGIRRTLDLLLAQVIRFAQQLPRSFKVIATQRIYFIVRANNDPAVHQEYPKEYGSQALAFVQSRLAGAGGNTTSSSLSLHQGR
ncbi:uncharacterized protein K444DRAFT_713306 [Hyaloscypha bicolor E]|uniref:Uncharacterized protein n=1 Tax=Hyaloscypha bicolor E TaxID=1095630 RepID=A0A2J6SFC1_9HELO|nr:uncharacterized protein K444DRAFT_713306 [Hyaloscypha bicolor E]PMD49453.1 hypothetical protein K444DRAFT_713306 [Hyaloscypha bicolor E]